MNRFISPLIILAGFCCATPAFSAQVVIGDIFLGLGPTGGTQQFFLDNLTGSTDGCSAVNGTPVCDDLMISGSLIYTFTDGGNTTSGSATLALPIGPDAANGGNSYAPANFQFSVADVFTSASFSGTLTPVSFSIDTNPGTATFNSDGTALSTDVIAGGGSALLFATSAATGAVPEPSSIVLLTIGAMALLAVFPVRQRS